ncbi:MAG: hypothetical protein VX589_01215 [Myxococcota bacterium]|nr:hypothetical protein [Myxococcota bacterium]
MNVPSIKACLTALAVLLSTIAGFAGCNQHPVQPLERVITAVNRQVNNLPAKTKIDFLFVIDNSGSMCQEQKNLGDNFKAFSDFLYDELRGSADYHIAVTSTDMNQKIGDDGLAEGDLGRFLTGADPNSANVSCQINNMAFRPDTAGCGAILQGKPIIKATEVQDKADLERKFNCLSTLGVQGDPNEAGLEAMREALSCNGPNRAFFGGCCVPIDPAANPNDPNIQRIFNPACDPKLDQFPEPLIPQFLRPDALLVVIFVTDENDCSYPALNTLSSTRPICRGWVINTTPDGNKAYIPPADGNGDLLPDTFDDPELCGGLDARTCYVNECQQLNPEECFKNRCVVDVNAKLSACSWQRDRLTPVREYYDFLTSLKGQPLEKLVVATIVGPQRYTPVSGLELFYVEAPLQQIAPECRESYGIGQPGGADEVCQQDSDCLSMRCARREGEMNGKCSRVEVPINIDTLRGEMCCPGGECKGTPQPTCVSEFNGTAYAGSRYIDFAGLFDTNGIGCPALNVEEVTPESAQACGTADLDAACTWPCEDGKVCEGKCRPIVGTNQLGCASCLSICEDSFEKPLVAIKTKVAEILATYCLEKVPQCVVRECNVIREGQGAPCVTPEEQAQNEISRACRTPDELQDINNYLNQIRLRQECPLTVAQGGKCERVEPPRILASTEWELELDQATCPGGARIKLKNPPPAGSEVTVEFFVNVGDGEDDVSQSGGALGTPMASPGPMGAEAPPVAPGDTMVAPAAPTGGAQPAPAMP